MKALRLLGLLLVCLVSVGCTTYYRVTDLNSGKNYYTTQVERERGGAVMFKDSRTGSEVTLQSTEITEVNQEQFEHGEE